MRPLNELAVLAFTLFTLMMVSVQAQAQTFDAGDLKYQVSGNTVKVKGLASGFTGTGIEIPSTVSHSDNGTTTTYTVATIDRDAFANNTSLISVDIGDSVTTIGQGAFQGNTSLISVDIGDSVTTIDAKAFRNNTNLKSLTIGNSVTTINDVAFESTDLTSVTIPDSVTYIGKYAFRYNPSLTSVTIGNSVESIMNLAFAETGLESVTIPASVTRIEYSAFELNEDLTRVTFLGDYYSSIRQSIFSDIDANQLTICTLEGASGWEGKYFFYSPYGPSETVYTTTCSLPPATPRKPVATRGDSQATVRWIKPPASGAPITGYTVTSSDGQTCSTDADTTSCVVTGLTNGIAYTFTVTATDGSDSSDPSPESNSVTPSAGAVPPSTPFAPVAIAGDGLAIVTWTKPPMGLNNASTITGYTVTSSDGQTCSTSDADALTCDVTGLTNGTAYTFTVTATNLLGASDTSSPSNSVTPGLEPAIPSAPVATAGNAQASVTWTKPDDGSFPIKSYTVISSGGEGCKTNDADTLTCVVTGLTNGTAYTFTVRAANELGASAASAPSNSVTPTEQAQVAPTVPVPTLPGFLLLALGGLLALFGIVGVRASN